MKKRTTLDTWFKQSGAFKWALRHHFTEAHFEPYTRAIGQVLLAWNDLHERLALLFVMAMGAGGIDRALSIWHSVRSDHSKREMLRTAMTKLPDGDKSGRDKLVDEIIWLLDATKALEGFRDDSAHTPLHYFPINLHSMDVLNVSNIFEQQVFPHTAFQNPRARRLDQKNKDLLIEHRYARDRIIVLRDYAIAIDSAWSNVHLPWPDRPSLPERKPIRRSKDRAARRKKK